MQKATSQCHQLSPTPPNKRVPEPGALRPCSISPVDALSMTSLRWTSNGEDGSGRSSFDVSPIEDVHGTLQTFFPAQTPNLCDISAPGGDDSSHQSIASVARLRVRRANSPSQSTSTTDSRPQDNDLKTGISDKMADHGVSINEAGNKEAAPQHTENVIQSRNSPANQEQPHDPSPENLGRDTRNRSTTKSSLSGNYRKLEVPPLRLARDHKAHVGSNQQTVSTGSPKRNGYTAMQAARTQIRGASHVSNMIRTAEGLENPSPSPLGKMNSATMVISARRGKPSPHDSTDENSRNHPSQGWPAAKKKENTKAKTPLAHAEDIFSHATWNSSRYRDQPPSRFSDTSCSTTANDSPPSSPKVGLERRIATPASSILSRKRPVQVAATPNSNIIARKPTPSEVQKSKGRNHDDQGSHKPLPKSPPEAQAVTRVASLEAKLESLRCRRSNLQTVIQELTNVTQRSPIALDMTSRQKMKQTIDGLDKELSEVGKEEHETGLQLHRAWKREEETSTYESSSLWVKRIAS